MLLFMSAIITSWRYPISEQRHQAIIASINATTVVKMNKQGDNINALAK
jgi:Na+/melibiose symporter-like transporter